MSSGYTNQGVAISKIKNKQTNTITTEKRLVGDIQVLLNDGRNIRGTTIYFFLPLAVMVSAICPPASQWDASQTPQTLKQCSPCVALVTVLSRVEP